MREDIGSQDEVGIDSQARQGWFASWHQLTSEEYFLETVLTGLRIAKGLSESHLIACFGYRARVALASPALAELCTEGLLQRCEGRLAATRAGFAVLDAVITEWLAAQ